MNDESHRDTKNNLPGVVRGGYSVFSCLVAKQSRPHEHSAASAATLRSTRTTTLDSSSTRAPVVVILVQLRTTRAHEHE